MEEVIFCDPDYRIKDKEYEDNENEDEFFINEVEDGATGPEFDNPEGFTVDDRVAFLKDLNIVQPLRGGSLFVDAG